MESARACVRVEDCDDLLLAEAGEPGSPSVPQQQVRGRGVKVVLALALGIAGAAAAFGGLAHTRAVSANVSQGVALFGQHVCSNCEGGSCHCDWANAETCSAKSHSPSCCWDCCCAQGGLQYSMPWSGASSFPRAGAPNFPSVGASIRPATRVATWPESSLLSEERGCHVTDGQAVHVTGKSGTTYGGTVVAYQGSGMYEIGIGSQSYPVHEDYIAECSIANAFLTFWLPLILVIALLSCVLFVLYKKYKGEKVPELPSFPEPKRRCCGE